MISIAIRQIDDNEKEVRIACTYEGCETELIIEMMMIS